MKFRGIDIPEHLYNKDPDYFDLKALEEEVEIKYGVKNVHLFDGQTSLYLSEDTYLIVSDNLEEANRGVTYLIYKSPLAYHNVLLSPEEIEKLVKLFPLLKKRHSNKPKNYRCKVIKVDFTKK